MGLRRKPRQPASRQPKRLGLDERIRAEEALYASMFHRGEGKITAISLAAAIVVHVLIILFAVFPSLGDPIQQAKDDNVIVVKKYVPPPPEVKPRQIVKKQFTRKVPIPDPTPDEPEPIREPEPEIEPEPLPPDVEFLIGVPDAPPPPAQTGPLIAGTGGVTNPKRIESTYIKPEYPELARVARIEGNVILQAVIRKDGTVGNVEVLRVNRPNMGFEENAVEAVKKWRYEPALQGDRPVDVYFTVTVEFTLN